MDDLHDAELEALRQSAEDADIEYRNLRREGGVLKIDVLHDDEWETLERKARQ